jgi:hypothetical protein
MSARPDVPDEFLDPLRELCLALPDAYEEMAWAGVRWCVRKKNFAHVVTIENGYPQAYAAVAGAGPTTILTFRASADELGSLMAAGPPFFKPPWFDNIIGLHLDERTDWGEVGELIIESYCTLAPAKLSKLVARPEL